MSKPRLIATRLSLPIPTESYDPKVQDQIHRAIENHVQTLQPAQQRQVVTGSKASGAALASLLTAMVNLGYITDSSTA